MAERELPPHVLRVPRWVLAIHAVQALFAIIILGLDAYGIRWIAYNALIFSLVNCICTLGVCIYLLGSQLFLHKVYNMYIALIAHLWMIVFWICDLGLHANLARLWAGPSCSYDYWYGYYCSYGKKRDLSGLEKRDTTTFTAYYGALAAGSVFCAVVLLLWVASGVITILHMNKHRSGAANHTTVNQPPPQYAPTAGQSVPMEKYNHTNVQTQPQATPQQQYAQPVQQPQGQYMQPQQHQGQYPQQQQAPPQQFGAPYPHDPVPRQDTVSPVSQVGYGAPPLHHNVSELSTPQHTGQPTYPTHASELSSPQHTGGYDSNLPELSNKK